MLSRRELIAISGIAIAGWAAGARAASDVLAAGCHLMAPVGRLGVGAGNVVPTLQADQQLITTSGNADLDHYLGHALLHLAGQFDVYPGFGFFDDSSAENALATRETKISGTNGTVVFGLNLFRDTLRDFHDQGMAVIAVCAHEFGHIYQYTSGFYDKLTTGQAVNTVKFAELHADYLAGFFLAGRKAAYPSLNLQGAGALFEKLGDTEFANPDHHGTPAQRVASIEAGFKLGRKSKQEIFAAATAGAEFVLEQFS
jgi:hypothetical protein